MILNKNILCLLIFAFGITPSTWAAKAKSPHGIVTKNSTQESEPSNFSGRLSISRSTSLYDFRDGTRRDALDYEALLQYRASKEFAVTATSSFTQDLKNQENNDISDIYVSLRRSAQKINDTFIFAYRLNSILPSSKDSRIRQSLITALGVGGTVGLIDTSLTGFEAYLDLTISKNFHTYKTGVNGSINNQYSSAQTVSLSYTFLKDFGLSLDLIHQNAWTYSGGMREFFQHNEELSYSLSQDFSMAVGHTNAGSVLKANGESNLALINENSSIVYLSGKYIF